MEGVTQASDTLETPGMAEHAEKFTGKSADYAQYRERYDPEMILPLLREWCGLTPTWTIADIGAGTGMLGDVFRANGNPVTAVEPNADMRAMCTRLHEADPLFRVVAASAEETGLPAASVDMVAVGRALHWFVVEQALREFRRILRPGGWVAVIAAGREGQGREENEAFEKLMQTWTGNLQSTRAGYALYQRLDEFFAGGELHHAEVGSEMHLDWEALRGLTLSISYAPLPGSPLFAGFEAALAEYFDRYQQGGRITIATRCWVNAGRFGASAS
jgi:SAM-dependent methyltransferase